MPLLAVLLVLLAVATLLLYVLPIAKSRLSGDAENRAVTLADAAADAAAESEERALKRELRLLTNSEGGGGLVVDTEGQILARAGDRPFSPPPEDLPQRDRGGGGGFGAWRWPRSPFGYPPQPACRAYISGCPRDG